VRWAWATLWLAYAALIFHLSSQPAPDLPILRVPWGDKWVHLGEFFLFGLLTFKTFEPRSPRAWALGFVVALAYAASDEIHQLYVPTRTASLLDWGTDALGIFAGALVYRWLSRGRRAPSR
jgi:VanZ family protein